MSSWRFTYWRSLLSIAIAGTSFLPGSYALAQIVPDAFIGNMSNVTQISNDLSIIVGGTQVGNSLFHSFSQLSVPTGNSAYFNNPLGIENIFTRVTGNNISNRPLAKINYGIMGNLKNLLSISIRHPNEVTKILCIDSDMDFF